MGGSYFFSFSLMINPLTLLVAQVAGPIMLVMAFGLLLNQSFYLKIYKDLDKNPFPMLLASMLSLTLGILLVIHHNIWGTPLEIVVTLLGWLSLVKGIALVVVPQALSGLGKKMQFPAVMIVSSLAMFVLGGYLCWAVYLV